MRAGRGSDEQIVTEAFLGRAHSFLSLNANNGEKKTEAHVASEGLTIWTICGLSLKI